MASTPNTVQVEPESPTSVVSGIFRLDLPERAVRHSVSVSLADQVAPPALSPEYRLRQAVQISVADSHPVVPLLPTDPVPAFGFERAVTLSFSYAGLADPSLPETALQVRIFGTRRNLWIEVPATFDYQAKTVTVPIWHEGTYALIANAGLIPIDPVESVIGPAGGSLDFARLRVEFPPGAFSEAVKISVTPPVSRSLPWRGGLPFPFDITARTTVDGREIHDLQRPVRLRVTYLDADIGSLEVDDLAIRHFDETVQAWEDLPSTVDRAAREILAQTTHLSSYTVGGSDTTENALDFGSNWIRSDTFTGAVTLAMPFELPPGPGGLVPDLKLVYSSQSSHWAQRANYLDVANGGKGLESASWLGEGFDIPIGYVQQTSDPQVGNTFYYTATVFGQSFRLVQDGSSIWHMQDEQFWKIDRNGTDAVNNVAYGWRLIRPDGTKYYFGTAPGPDYTDQMNYWDFSSGRKTNRWMLSRVQDPSGNLITMAYNQLVKNLNCGGNRGKITPAVYPTQINYGGQNASSLPISVVFNRSGVPVSTLDPNNPGYGVDRQDVNLQGWIWDGCTQLFFDIKYLDSIDVIVSGNVARRYKFTMVNPSIPMSLQKVEVWSDQSGTLKQTLLTPVYASYSDTDYPMTGGSSGPYVYWLLSSVANAFGGTTSFTYQFEAVDLFVDYDGWARIPYKGRAAVVTSATRDPGFGGTTVAASFSVYYQPLGNGNSSWPDFLGHNQVVTSETSATTTITNFYQGNMPGRMVNLAVNDAAGNRLQTVNNAWSATILYGVSSFVHLDSTDLFQGSGHKKTTYYYNTTTGVQGGTNAYGNLTDTYEYDAALSATQWIRHTARWFLPGSNADHYVVNRLAAENVYAYDGSTWGSVIRSALKCYDGATAWNIAIGAAGSDGSYRGRLTANRRNANLSGTTMYFDVTYEYDSFENRTAEKRWNAYGNLNQLASALTTDYRATTWQYDAPYNAYKLTETTPPNAFGTSLTTTYGYDKVRNRLTSVADANSQTTTHGYDVLGRRIATWLPGDDSGQPGGATIAYRYFIGGGLPTSVQIGRRRDAGGGNWGRRSYEWRLYDGLGRIVQTQKDFDRSGALIHAQDINDIVYGLGQDGVTPTVGAVTPHASVIQASDFTGLRSNIQTLWANASVGPMPDWSSGVTPTGGASRTPIFGSDLIDLRQCLNMGENGSHPPKTVTQFSYVAGNPSGNVVVVNRYYDGRGLLHSETVPHLVAFTVPGQFSKNDWAASYPSTTDTYDALKRPLTRVQPDAASTFSWSYNGWSTTGTDENGHATTTTKDVLGRLSQVAEPPGLSTDTESNVTAYQYDDINRTLTVTDASGINSTVVTFDSLGRKISQSDPDLGNWQFTYPSSPTSGNPLWLPLSQTDAKGAVVSFSYDKLDRILTRTGTGLSVTNTYDDVAVSYSKGRRTKMVDAAGTVVSYGYDPRGRLVNVARTIGGATYPLSTTYDDLDRPVSLTYPNGDTLTYNYGDHGMPVDLILNGAQYLVQGAVYNALGKMRTLPLGNGLTTSFAYYGVDHQGSVANRWYGLPYQIVTGALQNLTFSAYDLVGNPTSLVYTDHASETIGASYDQLDEIASITGLANESYGYDQFATLSSRRREGLPFSVGRNYDIGNLTSKNGASYVYPGNENGGGTVAHAPATVGSSSYGYDANGNRTSDPAYTSFTYDVENRLTALGSPAVLTNTYDGDGARVIRVANGTTTHYVGDFYENSPTTSVPTVYYPFNGVPIAMKSGSAGTLTYLHHDHLGNLVGASSTSGAEVGSARYLPFGVQRTGASTGTNPTGLPSDRLFTGQIRDLGNDAYYFFKSRYYDATIGKFQTADAMVPGAGNPQALNRYAYGLNNPLKFVDPSGHDSMDPGWKARWIAAHPGQAPSDQDWSDYQFSLSHPGTGQAGEWTPTDWGTYNLVRAILGRQLLSEVGVGGNSIGGIWGAVGTSLFALRTQDGWINGPDGTHIALGGSVPSGADAWTWGNTIIISDSVLHDPRVSTNDLRALIAHEYTHVLQYRATGFSFMPQYWRAGAKAILQGNNFGGPGNDLENPAYEVQMIYQGNSWLPAPWEFPR